MGNSIGGGLFGEQWVEGGLVLLFVVIVVFFFFSFLHAQIV